MSSITFDKKFDGELDDEHIKYLIEILRQESLEQMEIRTGKINPNATKKMTPKTPEERESHDYKVAAQRLMSHPLYCTSAVRVPQADLDILENVAKDGLCRHTIHTDRNGLAYHVFQENISVLRKKQKDIVKNMNHYLSDRGLKAWNKEKQDEKNTPEWFENYSEDHVNIAKSLAFFILNTKKKHNPFYNLALRIMFDKHFKLSRKQWRKFVKNNRESKNILNVLKSDPKFFKGQVVKVKTLKESRPLRNVNKQFWVAAGYNGLPYQEYFKEKLSSDHSLFRKLSTSPEFEAMVLFPMTIMLDTSHTSRYYCVKSTEHSHPIAVEERYIHAR